MQSKSHAKISNEQSVIDVLTYNQCGKYISYQSTKSFYLIKYWFTKCGYVGLMLRNLIGSGMRKKKKPYNIRFLELQSFSWVNWKQMNMVTSIWIESSFTLYGNVFASKRITVVNRLRKLKYISTHYLLIYRYILHELSFCKCLTTQSFNTFNRKFIGMILYYFIQN